MKLGQFIWYYKRILWPGDYFQTFLNFQVIFCKMGSEESVDEFSVKATRTWGQATISPGCLCVGVSQDN